MIAAALLAAAAIWLILLESKSYSRAVCRRINEFGYNVSPSDFYTQGYGVNTSIAEVVKEDLAVIIRQSRACGFSADVNKVGAVELMLCKLDDTRVLFVYLVDKEPELVFIEDTETKETFPLADK